jgi:hypothetical protein
MELYPRLQCCKNMYGTTKKGSIREACFWITRMLTFTPATS